MIGAKVVKHKKEKFIEDHITKKAKELINEVSKMNKKKENNMFLNNQLENNSNNNFYNSYNKTSNNNKTKNNNKCFTTNNINIVNNITCINYNTETTKNILDKQINSLNKLTLPTVKQIKESKLKLPLNLQDIDNDPYLSSVLLKNPDFMKPEEKAFIESFNKKEKAIFFEYLKIKSLEKNWVGNGYGSGNYLNTFIDAIKRNKLLFNNLDKGISLKEFMEKNMNDQLYNLSTVKCGDENNNKCIDNNYIIDNNIIKSKTEFNEYNEFDATNSQPTRLISDKDNKLKDKYKIESDFNEEAEKLNTQMNKLKLLLCKEKNNAIYTNIINNNDSINKDLNIKIEFLNFDIKQLKNLKEDLKNSQEINNKKFKFTNEKEEVFDKLISSYKTKLQKVENYNNNKLANSDLDYIKDIKVFKNKNNLTTLELLKLMDKNCLTNNKISLELLKESLEKYNILSNKKISILYKNLNNYFGLNIKTSVLQSIMDSDADKNTLENVDIERYKNLSDIELKELLSYYDEYKNKNSILDNTNTNLNSQLKSSNINTANEYILKKVLSCRGLNKMKYRECYEAANKIASTYKMYIVKKSIKDILIKRSKAAFMITRLIKKKLFISKKQKEIAAFKIFTIYKNSLDYENKKNKIYTLTKKWLKEFNSINRKYAAQTIQRYYRAYKSKILFENFSNLNYTAKLNYNLLQTRICYICSSNNVKYYCYDCDGLHYCSDHFVKNHSNKKTRNHLYMLIEDDAEVSLSNNYNFKNTNNLINKELIFRNNNTLENNFTRLKTYLNSKDINLEEHFKYWDYNNNGFIKYKNLVYSLNYNFFKFPKQYSDTILKYSLKFINNSTTGLPLDERYVNYKDLCFKLL